LEAKKMEYSDRPWLHLYDEGMAHDIEPEFLTALAMFQAAAAKFPDRDLTRYFDGALTMAEVDRMTDALAAGLRAHGFQPGDRLAVFLQNVPQFLLSMLAAWKAGGMLVPINPMNKEREVEYHLVDSGATVLVALESLYADVAAEVVDSGRTNVRAVFTTNELDLLGDETPPALFADSIKQRIDGTFDLLEIINSHDGEKLETPELGPDDIAIIAYTSGTTGPPKGATNTHSNVVFNSTAYRDWVYLSEEDVVLGVAPLFHITGLIAGLTLAFLVPMPLVLGYRFDISSMLDLIDRHRPTFTIGAITVFIALANDPDAAKRDFRSLTRVYSGGAAIAPSVADRMEAELGLYIRNAYGLTETTSPSHLVPFNRRAPVDKTSGALSVGVPIYNTVVRVVDDEGNSVPFGEIGEFVTRGPQVVSSYWGKPAETEHALPNGELFTGDVGFMNSDGWFFVVDRKKDQINASGYKVWPREVEDVLYEHPAVREAAVVGVADEYRGETVKAFVSLRPDVAVTENELIAFCKERMAAYKYPRVVEIVDELPKTVTGKILRRQLRPEANGS